eukprot:TRINITY_DN4099_c0_g1_i1.p1 TRINITY_DN4099_c0_g1~~TRINITY_DN4099_c0_g1_i1.p1  ORF type:complete len:1259 (+),score=483.00 TRINITY_DN4099_c0_g1_i1:314-3778(+)
MSLEEIEADWAFVVSQANKAFPDCNQPEFDESRLLPLFTELFQSQAASGSPSGSLADHDHEYAEFSEQHDMLRNARDAAVASTGVGGHALSSVLYLSGLYFDLEQEHERAATGDTGPALSADDNDSAADSGYEFIESPEMRRVGGPTAPPMSPDDDCGADRPCTPATPAEHEDSSDDLQRLHSLLSQRVALRHSQDDSDGTAAFDMAGGLSQTLSAMTRSRGLNRSLGLRASHSIGDEDSDADDEARSGYELERVREVLQLAKSEPIVAEFDASLVTAAGPLAGFVVLTDRALCFYDALVLSSKRLRLESYFEYEGRVKWNRRWLVLNNDTLQIFRRQKAQALPDHTLRLADIIDVQAMGSYKQKANCLLVDTQAKSFVFHADNSIQLQQWLEALKPAVAIMRHAVRVELAKVTKVKRELDMLVLPKALSLDADGQQLLFCNFTRLRLAEDTITAAAATAAASALALTDSLASTSSVQTNSSTTASTSPPLSPRSPRSEDDEAPDDSAPPSSHAVPDKVRAEFDRNFSLPDDTILRFYRCSLQRSLPLAGVLYITDNHICFHVQLLSHKRRVQIPWHTVSEIKLDTALWLIPLAITVHLGQHQDLVFFNFAPGARPRAFRHLREQWPEAQKLPRPLPVSDVQGSSDSYPVIDSAPSRRLKITILTIGSRGDVQPYLALALGLQKAGHTVTIATHEAFRDFVGQYGLGFANIGGDPRLLIELSVNNGMFTPKFMKVALAQFRGFVDELLKNSFVACQGCDAIISSPITMASYHVAEKLGVPLFLTFTMPWTRTRTYPNPFAVPASPLGGAYNYMTYRLIETVFWQPIRGQVNAYREHWGLPPISLTSGDPLFQKRVPFLYCFSPAVVPKPPDWGDEIEVAGFWFLDAPSAWKPSAELLHFINTGKEPLIYIGFGSIIVEDPDKLTHTIFSAVERAGVRCIMVKGWGGLGSIQVPPNVFMIDMIPHDWLFPKVEAVVHHGGAGTVAAGLRFGVPTVVVPFFGDQAFWGQRLEDLGVGTFIHNKSLTTDKLTAAIKLVVYDETVRRNAVALGQKLRDEDGVGRAVAAFHRYLDNAYVPPALRPKWSASVCHQCHQDLGGVHIGRAGVGQSNRLNCRNCGHVFCAKHCHTSRPLPKFFMETPVHVCNLCVEKLDQQEQ